MGGLFSTQLIIQLTYMAVFNKQEVDD